MRDHPWTWTWSDTAVVRVGPLFLKRGPVAPSLVILAALASLAIYIVPFVWYAQNAIAHTYPEPHTSFWFGLMHGIFLVPSFIVSWFDHTVTLYQSPNDGFWYNLGFLTGLTGFTVTLRTPS
jgi:hypothetical protein